MSFQEFLHKNIFSRFKRNTKEEKKIHYRKVFEINALKTIFSQEELLLSYFCGKNFSVVTEFLSEKD